MLNRREDGYHNIFGLFSSIDLYDLLILNRATLYSSSRASSIEVIPDGGRYQGLIRSISTNENLITKSVKAYLDRINKCGDVSISIKKDIPAKAGLGGGSSDAGACLLLLNSYFQILDQGELLQLGAEIGSDVPYCLTSGFAICEGTGDIIETIEGQLSCNILVLDTGIQISTAKAYESLGRGLDSPYCEDDILQKREMIRKILIEGEVWRFKNFFRNDFEESAFNKFPDLKAIKDVLYKMGADFVTMTGSGAAIIALFQDIEKTRYAEKKIGERVKNLYTTKFSEVRNL